MISSNLCNYSDAYIHVIPNTVTAAVPNNRNKKIILKNGAPFTYYISETIIHK